MTTIAISTPRQGPLVLSLVRGPSGAILSTGDFPEGKIARVSNIDPINIHQLSETMINQKLPCFCEVFDSITTIFTTIK